jgi:hypothetical protein
MKLIVSLCCLTILDASDYDLNLEEPHSLKDQNIERRGHVQAIVLIALAFEENAGAVSWFIPEFVVGDHWL